MLPLLRVLTRPNGISSHPTSITMRLRKSIRPPRRFDSEVSYQPVPQRSLRETDPETDSPICTPPYIDFDPNAPPAAFPTLDMPVPASGMNKEVCANNEAPSTRASAEERTACPWMRNQDVLCQSRETEDGSRDRNAVDNEGPPIDQAENDAASEGTLDSFYLEIMSAMASSDRDSADADVSMDNSDLQKVQEYNNFSGSRAARVSRP